MNAPSLETARLRLRAPTTADFQPSFAMWSNADITRHIGGKPSTAEEVWSRLLRYAGLWALLGYGYWVIQDKQTGQVMGEVGLADFRRDLTPSLDGAPEVGWVIAPAFQGRGIATEAVVAATSWADDTLHAARTVCLIAPANLKSVQVARKCGFREVAATTYKGSPTLLFERLRAAALEQDPRRSRGQGPE